MAKNVLIVDDDAARQASAVRDLRHSAACELVAVPVRVHDGGGFPARPAFDLILLDLQAPATTALAAAVQARSAPPAKGS